MKQKFNINEAKKIKNVKLRNLDTMFMENKENILKFIIELIKENILEEYIIIDLNDIIKDFEPTYDGCLLMSTFLTNKLKNLGYHVKYKHSSRELCVNWEDDPCLDLYLRDSGTMVK